MAEEQFIHAPGGGATYCVSVLALVHNWSHGEEPARTGYCPCIPLLGNVILASVYAWSKSGLRDRSKYCLPPRLLFISVVKQKGQRRFRSQWHLHRNLAIKMTTAQELDVWVGHTWLLKDNPWMVVFSFSIWCSFWNPQKKTEIFCPDSACSKEDWSISTSTVK